MRMFLISLIMVGIFFFTIRSIERSSLYVPFGKIDQTPRSVGLDYEDLDLKTPDGENLGAWFISSLGSNRTVLFFHGNGGNLSHRLTKAIFFHRLGFNVLMIDYRGYGRSSGSASEKGLYLDALAAYQELERRGVSQRDLLVFGESLGGAIAVELLTKKPAGGLILEGAFTSIPEMSRLIYPFLPAFFLSAQYDTASKISKIDIPVLLIHSRNDEVVPYSMGEKLFSLLRGRKSMLSLYGGHNDAFLLSQETVAGAIQTFFSDFFSVSFNAGSVAFIEEPTRAS